MDVLGLISIEEMSEVARRACAATDNHCAVVEQCSEPPTHFLYCLVKQVRDGIGWHTFRDSYRSWLEDTGAPMSVQKELMRHASIQTTMNVYGKAMTESQR